MITVKFLGIFLFNVVSVLHLNLDRAVETALRNNPTLSKYRVQVKSSKVSYWQTLTGYLPQPSLQVTYSDTRASIPLSQPGGPPIYSYTTKGYQVYLSMDQSLFDPDRLVSIWQKRNQKNSSLFQLNEEKNDIILQVKTAYFNSLKARRIVEERRKALERAKENLKFIENRYKLGSASKIDWLNAKVEEGQARLNLDKALRDQRFSDLNLLNLLGIEKQEELELEDVPMPEVVQELPELDSLLKIALERRPLLKSSKLSVSTQKSFLWYRTLSFLPRIRFGWYTSYYSEKDFPGSFREFWDNSTRSSGVYLSMSFDLFSYPFNIISANYSLDNERISYKTSRLQVIRDVTDAYNNYANSIESLNQAKLVKEQAEEALELAKEQYRLGSISSIELFDAESRFLESELTWVSAIYDYFIAKESLNRALGVEVIK